MGEVIDLNFGSQGNLRGQIQEFTSILSRAVGYASNDALVVEKVIRHLRNRRHGDARQCQRSGFAEGTERKRNQRARRGKNDCSIQELRRDFFCAPNPGCTKLEGKLAMSLRAREHGHLTSQKSCKLQNKVCRGSKAIKSQAIALPCTA